VFRPVVVWNDVRHVFDYVLARDGRHLISESKCWPLYEARSATADPKYVERQKELRAFLSFDVCEARCLIGASEVPTENSCFGGKFYRKKLPTGTKRALRSYRSRPCSARGVTCRPFKLGLQATGNGVKPWLTGS
jgi:hypothetical protein